MKSLAWIGGALLFLGGVAVSIAVLTGTKIGQSGQKAVTDLVKKVPGVGTES